MACRRKSRKTKTALETVEKEILEKEIELNSCNDEMIESMGQISKINVDQQKAKSMLEQNSMKKAELNQKILSNKTQQAAALEKIKQEEEALQAAKKELDQVYVERKELLKKKQMITANRLRNCRRNNRRSRKNTTENNLSGIHCRICLSGMKDMARAYAGSWNRKKDNPGLLGVVADIIQVEKKFETAVETALGGNIQNIVTEDEQVAKKNDWYIKEKSLWKGNISAIDYSHTKTGRSFQRRTAV